MEKTMNNEMEFYVENIISFCSSVQLFDLKPTNQTISLKEIGPSVSKSKIAEQENHIDVIWES